MTHATGQWVQVTMPGGAVRSDWVPTEQPPPPDSKEGSWHIVTDGPDSRWEWHPALPLRAIAQGAQGIQLVLEGGVLIVNKRRKSRRIQVSQITTVIWREPGTFSAGHVEIRTAGDMPKLESGGVFFNEKVIVLYDGRRAEEFALLRERLEAAMNQR